MIPISFCWNARKGSVALKVDGFVSSEWGNGRMTTKIFRMPISLSLTKEKTRFLGIPPARWLYLKGIFSFLKEWKMKKIEGTVSFPDPMVNGILYGWMSAVQIAWAGDGKIDVTVNFSGENRLEGEFAVSLKALIQHFRRWIYPLIREMRKKRSGGGEG